MNQARKRPMHQKVLSMILVLVMLLGLLSMSAFTMADTQASADTADGSYEYNIMFLDCGRKYYSVDSIKKIIDKASKAGFNYIQLAVGNDGLRFLLDDMSLTVEGNTYSNEDVTAAIQAGNKVYNQSFENKVTEDTKEACKYNPSTNELTEPEMDTIIAYAASKGMGVIPCVNTPGHMDAILSAATSLTGKDCSYNNSVRTIDVMNDTAVKFTQALLQKYINYFAGKGCQLFNMGADEYANDKYTDGSMGFGNLQLTGKYNYYVTYVNQVASMIKAAGMTPMAFNDGIYFNGNTSSGTFDNEIIICYWSNGWTDYSPMSASDLAAKGFKLINTNGSYYWVLGKSDAQCSADKAEGFDKTAFPGSTIPNPAGSMFCIWADYPGAETEADVIKNTAATIAAFGGALPKVPFTIRNAADATSANMTVGVQMKLSVNAEATWSVTSGADVVTIAAQTRSTDIKGTSVTIEALSAGSATITATNAIGGTATFEVTVNEPDTETITVAVGGTKTITVGGEVSGSLDDAIAKVTTKSTAASEKKLVEVKSAEDFVSGKQYLIFNNRQKALLTSTASNDWRSEYYGLLLNGAASVDNTTDLWTISGSNGSYTVKNNAGNYLTIGANTASVESNSAALTLTYNSDGYWNISQDFYYLNHLGSSTTAGGYKTDNNTTAATDKGSQWTIYKITGDASTDITFTGVSEGTTSVTIGGVKYNIKVVSKALADVDPLTVEYWITNRQVTANNATSKTINATDSTINSATGAKLSDLVPSEGIGMESGSNTVFWKGTRLTNNNKQNDDKGNDKTNSGNDFEYIRYWEGKWSFSSDGVQWDDFNADDQVVAYYLQRTNVTNEVETQVVDWGNNRSDYTYSTWVLLDYAVKYESGDRTPDQFPVTNKTLAFHCDYSSSADLGKTVIQDGNTYYRKIGAIRAEETDQYEVYMITVTPTSDTTTEQISATGSANTANSYAYNGTEKVVWVDNEDNLGAFADTSLQYEGFHVGGEATVPGLKIYNKQGMLVTYYVRAKAMPGNLTVHYVDDTTQYEFYHYDINVTNTATEKTAFSEKIGLSNPWKGPLANGSVTNSLGKPQTVTADLSQMPAIDPKYRYAVGYECVKVVRSADGTEVTLYYTFKTEKTFVVDFGLPLVIKPTDISTELQNARLTGVQASSNFDYASVTSDDACNLIYKLQKMMTGADKLEVTYSGVITTSDGEQTGSVTYTITIIPATNVYYEDSFATFTNCDGTHDVSSTDKDNGYWVTDGTTNSDAKQALEELGAQTKNVYGYDPAYQNCNQFSMGSATKVTVDANTSKDGQSPTATFTFKGTGFDVISLTGNQSGTVMYTVTNKGTNEKFSNLVNTYYGYKYENGEWTTTTIADPNALYQIPVIREVGLPYGEYEVTISVLYGKYFNSTANDYYSFWLDAIRVYDPMGKDNETYKQDGEGYPQYIKLRDSLAKDKTAKADTVFIDGAAQANVALYGSYGPNNEVYLANGQAITFKLPENKNIVSIQIGAKAPKGEAKLVVNETEKETLDSATEMYYDITDVANGKQVTISNTSDNILSLANLKITFQTSDTVTLAELTDTEQANAVAQVRALFAAPATEPFQPERFDASWSRSVRKGDTATLTVKASEDVEAITVNGETVDSYVERTERTGWGWWAKTVTYREFTFTTTADVTTDYTVCAVNAEGVSSDPITATLTVHTSVRDWLHGLIGKWF